MVNCPEDEGLDRCRPRLSAGQLVSCIHHRKSALYWYSQSACGNRRFDWTMCSTGFHHNLSKDSNKG